MWVMAGPAATRVLADYGATVVRVESTTSVDTARGLAPMHGGEPGPENSGLYLNMNAGKLLMVKVFKCASDSNLRKISK